MTVVTALRPGTGQPPALDIVFVKIFSVLQPDFFTSFVLFFSFLQMYLNYLGNYVPNTWNYEHGCSYCDDDVLDLSELKVNSSNYSITSICLFEFTESFFLASSLQSLPTQDGFLTFICLWNVQVSRQKLTCLNR